MTEETAKKYTNMSGCKVEFVQSFCWFYSMPNLLVIQHLEILYLGGNHVRVVCERVWRKAQKCALKKSLTTESHDWWVAKGDTRVKHARELKGHATLQKNGFYAAFKKHGYRPQKHSYRVEPRFLYPRLQMRPKHRSNRPIAAVMIVAAKGLTYSHIFVTAAIGFGPTAVFLETWL